MRAKGMLEGKAVVVTGSGGDRGHDIALAVAREGTRVLGNEMGVSAAGDGLDAGLA